jgi:hypothetical protein
MASIDEIKERIDLHDLAEKLGLERPDRRGNYRSPRHEDKSPSLSVFGGGKRWKDHSTGEGGTCIDLVRYVLELDDVGAAVRKLHELYGIPPDPLREARRREPKSRVEWIADQVLAHPEPAIEYLSGRGIDEKAVRRAIERRTVGFNIWTSPKIAPHQHGHGGPGVAFVVQSMNPGHVVAVDIRHVDPALNGGTKTQTQGEKAAIWCSDPRWLERAQTVYVVESPINALSVESCGIKGAAAVATRGTGTVRGIDWRFLHGKRVLLCFDRDEPDEQGRCAGQEAAWALHEELTALNISALLIDQGDWEVNDVNDLLQAAGPDELRIQLSRVEPWLIPGLRGDGKGQGRSRVFLPQHDFAQYWRYVAKDDFVRFIKQRKERDQDEGGGEIDVYEDLAGFRIASISRVTIASATSTMTGEKDLQPRTLFSVSIQAPRHGHRLQRRVFEDEKLHNVDQWKKFGPVFSQSAFLRLVNILERSADIGARHAINFVGLAWRDGRPVVNEGPDCYFTDPEKQCPYHNLVLPAGTAANGRSVIEAYQTTFRHNAASQILVWALGAHLKALLGFWPHMTLQADKGAGKSTLVKRLERTIACTMFAGESIESAFRLLTSTSHTSHVVGWEELSARKQDVIDKAVSLLQQAYQYSLTRRGSEMTEYLVCAPVLLAGEDVPVRSLMGKVVRSDLTGKKGPLMPEDLPVFPLRQWLEFLAGHSRATVRELHSREWETLMARCSASSGDEGARRMVGNYAAVAVAWRLLCEFCGIPDNQGAFLPDLAAEMNSHVLETSAEREPWVWITEVLLSELASNRFAHPFAWASVYPEGSDIPEDCICVRTSHVIDHLAHNASLREKWNSMPVKTDRVFKRQLRSAGVIVSDSVERTIGGRRVPHMTALGLDRLAEYGLHAAPAIDVEPANSPSGF